MFDIWHNNIAAFLKRAGDGTWGTLKGRFGTKFVKRYNFFRIIGTPAKFGIKRKISSSWSISCEIWPEFIGFFEKLLPFKFATSHQILLFCYLYSARARGTLIVTVKIWVCLSASLQVTVFKDRETLAPSKVWRFSPDIGNQFGNFRLGTNTKCSKSYDIYFDLKRKLDQASFSSNNNLVLRQKIPKVTVHLEDLLHFLQAQFSEMIKWRDFQELFTILSKSSYNVIYQFNYN